MVRATRAVFVVLVVPIASLIVACSLVTNFDGLSGGSAPAPQDPDGSADGAAAVPCNGGDCSCASGDCSCVGRTCNTTCPATGPCKLTCFGGNCTNGCGAGQCTVGCTGGSCNTTCPAGGTCNVSGFGTIATTACAPGSTCSANCTGGSCTLQCAAGATCTCQGGCVCQGPGCP